jgi:hypothetical protein
MQLVALQASIPHPLHAAQLILGIHASAAASAWLAAAGRCAAAGPSRLAAAGGPQQVLAAQLLRHLGLCRAAQLQGSGRTKCSP